ncbi:tetraspanin family protein [Oesophagostomum dentatum]|uniref:Tetraspanin family protein n=1 Tax=Oesophagostomum dentatum TaxID=61180 RepID=A0A0B1T4H4_OESDE|nr:tetraspanin family protein [Oesophagostomum dentatum]
MGGCVKTLRSLVFIFNLLFWIAGIVTIGLGLWLLFDPVASDFFALHSAHHGSFRVVGWLLLAAGAIMTFVGCCGCCGAWKMSQCALVLVGEIVFFDRKQRQRLHLQLFSDRSRAHPPAVQLTLICDS